MEMYAQRKGWDVGDVEVACEYTPAERGCPTRFNLVMRFPDTLSRRAGRAPAGDRRQVPRAPHARRRGHVRRAVSSASRSRAELARRADVGPARRRAGRRARGPRQHQRRGPRAAVRRRRAASCTPSSPGAATTCAATPARSRSPAAAPDEGEGLIATALREAHEEIGLPAGDVEIVGALQPTPTIATNYAVYPFVGLIDPGREWTLSPREVDAVLEFSIDDLRAGYDRRRMLRRGVPFRTDVYVVGEDLIWGATARILADLLVRLDALLGRLDDAHPGLGLVPALGVALLGLVVG